MRSDYDKRESLNALTKSGASLDGNAAFEAVAEIKSSYDKRMAFTQIIDRGGLSADTKRALLRAVADMKSDYDRREVLTAYVKKVGVESSALDAFFSAVDALRSHYHPAQTPLAVLTGHTVHSATRFAFL